MVGSGGSQDSNSEFSGASATSPISAKAEGRPLTAER
jgi:hypothetical protein